MSYGKIPVVTRIPSIQEVLEKYEIGLWSTVKNVEEVIANMIAIEKDFNTLKVQGKTARQIVEDNYTWPQICDRYIELVKDFSYEYPHHRSPRFRRLKFSKSTLA